MMNTKQNDGLIETAYGVFYGAGIILAAGTYLTLGLLKGAWIWALPACLAGGIGFGLLANGFILYRIARLRESHATKS
jgi:hypothetical protein